MTNKEISKLKAQTGAIISAIDNVLKQNGTDKIILSHMQFRDQNTAQNAQGCEVGTHPEIYIDPETGEQRIICVPD